MNKKDKDLLIKDLSARVFYGVKVNIERDFPNNPQIVERIAKDGEIIVNGILAYDIYYYKPYLRPMSSMTEEEREELCELCEFFEPYNDRDDFSHYGIEIIEEFWVNDEKIPLREINYKVIDWLNEHHLDYRGLIPMGLALEALEGMYKTE